MSEALPLLTAKFRVYVEDEKEKNQYNEQLVFQNFKICPSYSFLIII